jgi:hypothetical protein
VLFFFIQRNRVKSSCKNAGPWRWQHGAYDEIKSKNQGNAQRKQQIKENTERHLKAKAFFIA